MLLKCPIRTCFFCKKVGPDYFQADCYKNPSRRSSTKSSSSTITAATTDSSESDISTAPVTLADITALLKHVTSSPGSVMVTTTGTSWFFDSGCCNHMTSDPTIFTSKSYNSHTTTIKTADGSQLPVSHVGTVTTTSISLPAIFHILKLTINLIYVGQLCDLRLNVIFFSSGCHV
ncbi:hypothetical protein LguiB_024059 [Lonicera macranthoides]